MFLSRNKKNNVYPWIPQFYYIKVGLRGSNSYRHVFMMDDRVLVIQYFSMILHNTCTFENVYRDGPG